VHLVPAGDIDALAGGMAAVLGDASRRHAMVSAGRQRAESYTWARTAEGVRQAYLLARQ